VFGRRIDPVRVKANGEQYHAPYRVVHRSTALYRSVPRYLTCAVSKPQVGRQGPWRPVGDPAFVPVVRVERNVGGQLMSLDALTGHRPVPRRLRRQMCDTNAGHGTGPDVFPVDGGLHRLEIWLRAIQLSPYSAGPAAARARTPGHDR
jgi:hypothetical protein